MDLLLTALLVRRLFLNEKRRAETPPCDGRLSMALCRCGAQVVHQRPPAQVQ